MFSVSILHQTAFEIKGGTPVFKANIIYAPNILLTYSLLLESCIFSSPKQDVFTKKVPRFPTTKVPRRGCVRKTTTTCVGK